MKAPAGWNTSKLGDVTNVILSNVDKKSRSHETPVRLCNYTDVYYNRHIKRGMSFMEATAAAREIEKFQLKKNDVLITKDSETADDIAVPALVVDELPGVLCGYHLAILRPIAAKVSGAFLCDALRSHRNQHYFSTLANGVTRFGLTADAITEAKIILPPLAEQRKIAEILGAWDAAIETVDKLITAKRHLKRGLMQQLLTGKRRFKEFGRKPQHMLTIGDIAEEISRKNDARADFPVLSCTKHRGLVLAKEFFAKRIHAENTSSYKVVKRNEFAYATNHIEEGSIGIQTAVPVGLVSPMYTVFSVDAAKAMPQFLLRILKTESYRQQFEARTNGSINRRGGLRWNEFARIPIRLPGLAEQRRIEAVLSNVDVEIVLLEAMRNVLNNQKRGLMQKLLTGKIRVTVKERKP